MRTSTSGNTKNSDRAVIEPLGERDREARSLSRRAQRGSITTCARIAAEWTNRRKFHRR
jgi:hypothetical protein